MAAVLEKTAAPVAPQPPPAPTPNRSLIRKMADRFEVDADKLLTTLKATAFRQREDRNGHVRDITHEEMMALLIIADQYKLNPFTRELFAFFDSKSGAIVPVVSVDGWSRIINEHAQLDGIAFRYSEDTGKHKGKTVHVWMECAIKRKDRSDPIVIREFFDEVVREVTYATPWDSHPKRMHRHKTLIQCARLAFGFAGIYDEDEAQRIVDGDASYKAESNGAIDSINAQIDAAKGNGHALTHAPSPVVTQAVPAAAQTVSAPAEPQVTTPTPPSPAADAGAVSAGADPDQESQAVAMKVADFRAAFESANDSDELNEKFANANTWAMKAPLSAEQRATLKDAYDKQAKKFAPPEKKAK